LFFFFQIGSHNYLPSWLPAAILLTSAS
jgi:hypothetical protein